MRGGGWGGGGGLHIDNDPSNLLSACNLILEVGDFSDRLGRRMHYTIEDFFIAPELVFLDEIQPMLKHSCAQLKTPKVCSARSADLRPEVAFKMPEVAT